MSPFVFRKGETIQLALDAVEGDPAAVDAISARIRPLPPGRTSVAEGGEAASFQIAARAAAGDSPAGWTLTLPAAVSAALPAGFYLADARLEVAGGVILSEPVTIRLRDAVSA
jgi:hypothetical protein